MMRRDVIASLAMLLAVASLARATSAATSGAGSSCTHCAAGWRERLEQLIEPVVDGESTELVPLAARAAAEWPNCRRWARDATVVDTLVAAMQSHLRAGKRRLGAQRALEASIRSFAWCDGPASVGEDLARLDLLGQAAWFNARGIGVSLPGGCDSSVIRVSAHLHEHRKPTLATRLDSLAARAASRGPGQPSERDAHGLLDLVDEIEIALR